MKSAVRFLAVATALAGLSAPAQAALTFTVNLTTSQEPSVALTNSATGQPRPTPFGTATFTINDAQTAMTFFASITNIDFTGSQSPNDLNDNLTNAHIHASSTGGTPTFPVVWGFIGAPFNDNNPNDAVVTPFATGVGGTVSGKWDLPEGNNTTFSAQLANILAGRAYINFHTVQNPGGELRGNFSQALPVPEPASWAMILLGFGAIGLALRRTRVRATA
jgi:hypothetical protein